MVLIIFQTDLILWLRTKVNGPKLSLNCQTLDYRKADSADSKSGFKGQSALVALQKGKKQHRIVRSHLLRIGSESASSNRREEAQEFSNVDTGFLSSRIRNRGSRGTKKKLQARNIRLPQPGSHGRYGYVCYFMRPTQKCRIWFGFIQI